MTEKTADVLNGNATSAIESICRVLDRFNDQGIEVPSVISNFSRSALMLEQQMSQLNRICAKLPQRGGRPVQRYYFAETIENVVKQGVRNMSPARKAQRQLASGQSSYRSPVRTAPCEAGATPPAAAGGAVSTPDNCVSTGVRRPATGRRAAVRDRGRSPGPAPD